MVFDDSIKLINELKQNPYFMSFFYNRRNIIPGAEISVIVTTQNYVSIPCKVRNVATSLIMFQLPEQSLKKIMEDWGFVEQKKLLKILKDLKKYDFLMIQVHKWKYFLNFKEISL